MTDVQPLWNVRHIPQPPFCTVPCPRINVPSDEIGKSKEVLKRTIEHLEDSSFEDSEKRLLDQLVHKSKYNFRGQKILLSLRRVQRCLQIFRDMLLTEILTTCLADLNSIDMTSVSAIHLPARGVIDYVLTRLIGATALLGKIVSYCIYGYVQSHQHLSTGMFIPLNLVIGGLVSRVRALSLNKIHKLTVCYKTLHELKEKLHHSNVQWLQHDETLPTDLVEWMTSQPFNFSLDLGDSERKSKSAEELNSILSRHGGDCEEVIDLCCSDSHGSEDEIVVDRERLAKEEELQSVDVDEDNGNDRNLQMGEGIDLGEPVSRNDGQDHVMQEITKLGKDYGEPVARKIFLNDRHDSELLPQNDGGKMCEAVNTACATNLDIAKATVRFRKCKHAFDFRKVIKKFDLKNQAKAAGVKGFVKLEKKINKLEGIESPNDYKEELKLARVMAVKLCDKIQNGKVTVDVTHTDDYYIDRGKAKQSVIGMLNIKSIDVNEHFANHLKHRKHLIALRKELHEYGNTFHFQRQSYQLSNKKARSARIKLLNFCKRILHKRNK